MIEVDNLTKEFKIYDKYEGLGGAVKSFFTRKYTTKKAVDGLSFCVEKGEMLGYIGLNGAGKSTTIKVLSGLMVPTSGKCIVNGLIPYEERKKYTKNIGVVFGNRSQLWWDLPVSESFSVLRKIYEVPQKEFNQRLDFLKEVLGLEEFYLAPVRTLSLGQKMRADLAASMLHNPQVLFLDEPTIGLDILVKENIRNAIRQINLEKGTTVLLTTHDLDDIERICSKIIVIDAGHKIFDGNLDELKNKYGNKRSIFVEMEGDVKQANYFQSEYIHTEVVEQGRVLIRFDKDKVHLPSLMKELVAMDGVKDFTVLEPQLEEVVKTIYGKVTMEGE